MYSLFGEGPDRPKTSNFSQLASKVAVDSLPPILNLSCVRDLQLQFVARARGHSWNTP